MTVLFGFTSLERNASFLGGDDLEGMSGRRNDKVFEAQNRFLIGGLGNNTVFSAANLLSTYGEETTIFADGSSYQQATSIEELCGQIQAVLPIVADHTYKAIEAAVKTGQYSHAQLKILETQPSHLVIIDTRQCRMALADFGNIYATLKGGSAHSYTLSELEPECVFRFGIDKPLKLGLIPDIAFREAFAWCNEHLQVATEYLARIGRRGVLGKLGSCYLIAPGIRLRRTTFASTIELARMYYPVIKS